MDNSRIREAHHTQCLANEREGRGGEGRGGEGRGREGRGGEGRGGEGRGGEGRGGEGRGGVCLCKYSLYELQRLQ